MTAHGGRSIPLHYPQLTNPLTKIELTDGATAASRASLSTMQPEEFSQLRYDVDRRRRARHAEPPGATQRVERSDVGRVPVGTAPCAQ